MTPTTNVAVAGGGREEGVHELPCAARIETVDVARIIQAECARVVRVEKAIVAKHTGRLAWQLGVRSQPADERRLVQRLETVRVHVARRQDAELDDYDYGGRGE